MHTAIHNMSAQNIAISKQIKPLLRLFRGIFEQISNFCYTTSKITWNECAAKYLVLLTWSGHSIRFYFHSCIHNTLTIRIWTQHILIACKWLLKHHIVVSYIKNMLWIYTSFKKKPLMKLTPRDIVLEKVCESSLEKI